MLEGFPEYTSELTAKEAILAKIVLSGLIGKTKDTAKTGCEIVKAVNKWVDGKNEEIERCGKTLFKDETITEKIPKLSLPKFGKMVQGFRINGIPVIAIDKNKTRGYFISYDEKDIISQIESLEQRARGVLLGAKGLKKLVSTSEIDNTDRTAGLFIDDSVSGNAGLF